MTIEDEIKSLRETIERQTKMLDELEHQIEYLNAKGVNTTHQFALLRKLRAEVSDQRNQLSALERRNKANRDP
jgi:hypothetical protein